MKRRTKHFALNIIRLVASLPQGRITEVIGRQLLRSGTSVGSNYRSACRSKSTADFISKMGVVEEEADETMYWMELLIESGLPRQYHLALLLDGAPRAKPVVPCLTPMWSDIPVIRLHIPPRPEAVVSCGRDEANQILAITVSSIKTARRNRK